MLPAPDAGFMPVFGTQAVVGKHWGHYGANCGHDAATSRGSKWEIFGIFPALELLKRLIINEKVRNYFFSENI